MLTRRGLLTLGRRPIYARLPIVGKRLASNADHHSDHSDYHHQNNSLYPEETFNTPFWRRIALTFLLGVVVYQGYPHLDKDGDYLTRYIAYHMPDSRLWRVYDTLGVYAAIKKANGQLLIESAQQSPIHRLRNPMSLDYASARNVPVGSKVDVSKVQVKRSDTWA